VAAEPKPAGTSDADREQFVSRLKDLSGRLKALDFSVPLRASAMAQWNQAFALAKEGKLTKAVELLNSIDEKLAVAA